MKPIRISTEKASGRRKSWWKRITGVTPRGAGARAFSGEHLQDGEYEFPPGTVLLEVVPQGTAVSGKARAQLYRVNTAGTKFGVANVDWQTELEDLKKTVRYLLTTPPPDPVWVPVPEGAKEHPLVELVRKVAPSMVVTTEWATEDDEEPWDPAWGDRDDFECLKADILAKVIVRGEEVVGEACCSSHYNPWGKPPDVDIGGYFPQELAEAITELSQLGALMHMHQLQIEIKAALRLIEQWMAERYEAAP